MIIQFIKKGISSKAFKPTAAVFLAVLFMIAIPDQFVNPAYKQYEQCKARVLSVNNIDINSVGVVKYGQQACKVKILNGSHKGKEYEAINMLSGALNVDKEFVVGDIALVSIGANAGQDAYKITMVDHYRTNYISIIAAGFVLILIVLAGWTGLRAVLSFVFTILSIWKVLIPLMLNGVNPIICGALITVILTTVIIVLVYGFDKRFISATIGSLLSTGLTALISIMFVHLMNIHGAVMDYSESLLYAGYDLNLTEIFIASIFIGSSGALMDIAVDITSAIQEVIAANPETTRQAAIRAGMSVGRNALGTMTTTLLLAYSGSYIALLMVFVAQGTPLIYILNINYVAAEILNILVGSFGLITVVPFTALISGTMLPINFTPSTLKNK